MLEKQLQVVEAQLISELCDKLGRDALKQFSTWKSGSDSATCHFVCTSYGVFGPRGDAKNGCRQFWVAFCDTLGKKSEITSFRMNRFSNLFLGAATLVYHATYIDTVICHYKENLNLKLKSVLADSQSAAILSLSKALGFLYYKVTGPFWKMLESDV